MQTKSPDESGHYQRKEAAMQSSATDRYLQTEVLTASPQKLQRMLLDAAIRSAERAGRHLDAEKFDEAHDALVHAQQVVTELLSGLKRDANPPLAGKRAALYVFVFRSLVDAGIGRDRKKLDDALRILRIERETWRRVCQEAGNAESPERPLGARLSGEPAHSPQTPTADLSGSPPMAAEIVPGFSMEA
jgi:flagellar biosynthetic protein FliS